MLRNVLGDYLSGLRSERDFDAPFLALVRAMGYQDVHLTHGPTEKGKDFIAKDREHGRQWVFQSKKGDVDLDQFRKDVLPQLVECAITGLQHPAFDCSLPRGVVLVLTGEPSASVNDRLADLITEFSTKHQVALECWSRSKLIELLLDFGLNGLHRTRVVDIERQGKFFMLYGSAVRQTLESRDIEEHSCTWLDPEIDEKERTLVGTIESAILAAECRKRSLLYDSFQCELAALRMALQVALDNLGRPEFDDVKRLVESQLHAVLNAAKDYTSVVHRQWTAVGKELDRAIRSPAIFATYPVHCCRLLECIGLLILAGESSDEVDLNGFLLELVKLEPGCVHPISDRYVVSTVLATLAMMKLGEQASAEKLVINTTIWACDRIQNGYGLAGVDDSVKDEVIRFLGYPFECFELRREADTMFATALADLAGLLSPSIFTDVVNEFKAVRSHPAYFQAQDDEGQFVIDSEAVRQYSNVRFDDQLADKPFEYADHVRLEPNEFRLAKAVGVLPYLAVALFLRDRYFPKLWPEILKPS